MARTIVIGTRGSDLALWQANTVKKQLEELGQEVSIKIIKTRGDLIQDRSFDKIEGKGFFTKELEEELLNLSIDLAVHSHKDLETSQPEGLIIAAVSARENPADLLLVREEKADSSSIFSLPQNAVVGSSSARRKAQLLKFCPSIVIKDIRGNVPTRVRKLREGEYDAIMLARAGVKRLNLDLQGLVEVEMDAKEFIPAPAQGVLALQIRSNDENLQSVLSTLNHPEVQECIGVERKILSLFKGGCQLPLGAYCEKRGANLELHVSVADSWNTLPVSVQMSGTTADGMAEEAMRLLALKKKGPSS